MRRRFLVAMGLPGFAVPFACAQQGQLVSAPLFEGDAAVLASAYDGGKLPVATASTVKTAASDPPEPTPPTYMHTTGKICRDDLTVPIRAELPPPWDACPRRFSNGEFSAKTTRAERANNPDTCCYITFGSMAVPGRALRDPSDRAVVAEVARRDDWCERGVARVEARDRWLADAALEHASIAAFARLSLELLAHAAPPDLIAAAHAAALDEIAHAKIAYAFASGRHGPGPLAIEVRPRDLAALARETFVDGCIGETVAAIEARERAEREPEAREALMRIADDEERHAELAWRVVAWALRVGGDSVRAALRDATAIAPPSAAAAIAMREIVRPCACALLASG